MGRGGAVRGSQRARSITISSSRIRTFHSDPMALRFHSLWLSNSSLEIGLPQAMPFPASTQRVVQPLGFVGHVPVNVGTGNLGLEQNQIATFRGSSQNALRKATCTFSVSPACSLTFAPGRASSGYASGLKHYSFYAVVTMYASQFSDLVLSQQWVPSPAKVDWTYVAKQVANLFVQCSEIRMSVPPSFDLRFTSGINLETN